MIEAFQVWLDPYVWGGFFVLLSASLVASVFALKKGARGLLLITAGEIVVFAAAYLFVLEPWQGWLIRLLGSLVFAIITLGVTLGPLWLVFRTRSRNFVLGAAVIGAALGVPTYAFASLIVACTIGPECI